MLEFICGENWKIQRIAIFTTHIFFKIDANLTVPKIQIKNDSKSYPEIIGEQTIKKRIQG